MKKRNYGMVVLIFIIFALISILTNIMNSLIPDVKSSYNLSYFYAGMVPLAFFIAYGFMSIPAGMMASRLNKKTMLVFPFVLTGAASLLFCLFPVFPVYLLVLFSIGTGMAILQVVINPLLRASGGEEHFAANSEVAQFFFSGAGYLAPKIYSYLVTNLGKNSSSDDFFIKLVRKVTPENLHWVSIYWVFLGLAFLVVVILLVLKLPDITIKENEKIGAWQEVKGLFKNKYVVLFFIGIFCYVGSESGIANNISLFLQKYHGVDPRIGADIVAYFWGAFTIGCLVGIAALKLFDSKRVLFISTVLSIVMFTLTLFASTSLVKITIPLIGFFYSVMWPVVFSLALNSVKKHHGTFSGILCTGIAGGAIIPAIIGLISDAAGLKVGMMFVYITLGYVLLIGVWAKPIVRNKTVLSGRE
jgi:fucose permease